LKYGYTFPEVLKLKEFVEMMDAIQEASYKDEEIRIKNEKPPSR
jgi:hypothetical protein